MKKALLIVFALSFIALVALFAQTYDAAFHIEPGGDRAVVASGGSLDVESGGEIDVESGGSLKIAGTAVSSTAAELNALDGVSATAAELDAYVIQCEIEDISTAQSDWVVAPHAGDIIGIWSVIDTAITVADAALTFEIGGTAVTDGGITVAFTGSAAGTVDSSTPSAANALTAGQALECITDGGSTDASKAEISILVSR
jgi:hypothetical protein